MSDEVKRGLNPAMLTGVILIVVGALLLLDQMNVISVDFWALVLFAVGLMKLFQSDHSGGRTLGVLLIGGGILVELESLGKLHLELERTWPVFVILAGLIMLWRAYQQEPAPSGLSPHLNVFAIWGGGEYRIRAKNFRGGDLVAFMGGFDVDLRDADIEGDQAVVNVNCLMGGGVIRIPETWAVSMRVSAFMGGHSLKAREGPQPTKTLVVKGTAIMGGVEVRN